MTRRARTEAPRFTIGQTVLICDSIMTTHAGQVGTVSQTQLSRYNRTLYNYEIRFPSGIQRTFWDIQLESVT
jgi:hypothetical protein